MTGRLYEAAETLAYDPVVANRHATRAALHTIGFQKLEFPGSLEDFARALKGRSPDFLLFEVSGAEREICRFIQSVRQGEVGENPFVVIIATTWRRNDAVVNQIINSGADDLVARPFSTTLLAERIRLQVEQRKGFVVTADYIGPDRRRDPTRACAECFEVTNSLRLKTSSNLPADELEHRIAAAITEEKEFVNLERIRRTAFQLCVQWRLLEKRHPGARDFGETLARILTLSDEIRRRSEGTPLASVSEWCECISDSVRNLGAASIDGGNQADTADIFPSMQLLEHAAMMLGQMLVPSDVHPSHLVELDALVAKIDAHKTAASPTPF